MNAAPVAVRSEAPRRRAPGFSLVEVLVALFVVAMGILALAGLLQASTRSAKMSELRSTATLLANDIADRIRANAMGAQAGANGYDVAWQTFAPTFAPTLSPARADCTRQAPCGASDLARMDIAEWSARLRATLPNGSAWVRFHAGNAPGPDYVDVWVGWPDPSTQAPDVSSDRPDTECPAAWTPPGASVRCVYLQVAL